MPCRWVCALNIGPVLYILTLTLLFLFLHRHVCSRRKKQNMSKMPSQVLQPVLKMKVDELFFNWLSEPATQSLLKEYLDLIKNGQYPDMSSGDTQDKSSLTFNGNNNNVSSQKNLAEKKNAAFSAPSSPPSTSALPSGSSINTRMTGPNGRAPRRSVNIRKVNHLLKKGNILTEQHVGDWR